MDNLNTTIMQACPNLVLSRIDAIRYGFEIYRTGEICHKGHAGWLWVRNATCVTCTRQIGYCASCITEECPTPTIKGKEGINCSHWTGGTTHTEIVCKNCGAVWVSEDEEEVCLECGNLLLT